MGNMNINIINPVINLVSTPRTSSNKCESTFEFTIKSTPYASVTIAATIPSGTLNKDDLRELAYDLGSGYKLAPNVYRTSTMYPFLSDAQFIKYKEVKLNSTGQAKVRVVLANSEEEGIYLGTTVYVKDYTNDKESSKTFVRYNDSIKCKVGQEPVAIDDKYTVNTGSETNFFILNNDLRLHYIPDFNAVTIITQPSHGTVTFMFGYAKYINNGDGATTDSFTYTIETPTGLSSVATVSINVVQPNTPTNPNPDAPTIDGDTKLYILFDDSGSMFETLPLLEEMRDTETSTEYDTLQSLLIPHYGSKANYLENVKISYMGDAKVGERFLKSTYEKLNPNGNTIVLIFQDESAGHYQGGTEQTANDPLQPEYFRDITDFNIQVDNYDKQLNVVMFQIKTYLEGTYYHDFKKFMKWVKGGVGNYARNSGLAYRNNFQVRYDVDGGGQPGIASAEYYTNLVKEELNKLGFNL